jgi:hypothetical protein
LITPTLTNIYVKHPQALRAKFKNPGDEEGNIEYSISTFGYLDYQSKTAMVLKKWSTEFGCSAPSSTLIEPDEEGNEEIVAYIMKRGDCTYYKKAENVNLAGGRLAIVAMVDDTDPERVIPIGPKTRKFLFFRFFKEFF